MCHKTKLISNDAYDNYIHVEENTSIIIFKPCINIDTLLNNAIEKYVRDVIFHKRLFLSQNNYDVYKMSATNLLQKYLTTTTRKQRLNNTGIYFSVKLCFETYENELVSNALLRFAKSDEKRKCCTDAKSTYAPHSIFIHFITNPDLHEHTKSSICCYTHQMTNFPSASFIIVFINAYPLCMRFW